MKTRVYYTVSRDSHEYPGRRSFLTTGGVFLAPGAEGNGAPIEFDDVEQAVERALENEARFARYSATREEATLAGLRIERHEEEVPTVEDALRGLMTAADRLITEGTTFHSRRRLLDAVNAAEAVLDDD